MKDEATRGMVLQTTEGRTKWNRIKNFFKDESGASAVEYGLLVTLIW